MSGAKEHTFACDGGPFDGSEVVVAVDTSRDYELRLAHESSPDVINVYRPRKGSRAHAKTGVIKVAFVRWFRQAVSPSVFDDEEA